MLQESLDAKLLALVREGRVSSTEAAAARHRWLHPENVVVVGKAATKCLLAGDGSQPNLLLACAVIIFVSVLVLRSVKGLPIVAALRSLVRCTRRKWRRRDWEFSHEFTFWVALAARLVIICGFKVLAYWMETRLCGGSCSLLYTVDVNLLLDVIVRVSCLHRYHSSGAFVASSVCSVFFGSWIMSGVDRFSQSYDVVVKELNINAMVLVALIYGLVKMADRPDARDDQVLLNLLDAFDTHVFHLGRNFELLDDSVDIARLVGCEDAVPLPRGTNFCDLLASDVDRAVFASAIDVNFPTSAPYCKARRQRTVDLRLRAAHPGRTPKSIRICVAARCVGKAPRGYTICVRECSQDLELDDDTDKSDEFLEDHLGKPRVVSPMVSPRVLSPRLLSPRPLSRVVSPRPLSFRMVDEKSDINASLQEWLPLEADRDAFEVWLRTQSVALQPYVSRCFGPVTIMRHALAVTAIDSKAAGSTVLGVLEVQAEDKGLVSVRALPL